MTFLLQNERYYGVYLLICLGVVLLTNRLID